MLKPHPDYRANPNRAVYIQGRIDQSLVDKLTPKIMSLQSQSRDPITVYIDSSGGYTFSADTINRLLRAPDQDYSPGCRLVTVVTGRAASAAADLLCAGNYAMALPESTILFHGGRRLPDDPITITTAPEIMESLRSTNDRYALALAERALSRFGFRYVSQRSHFAAHRIKIAKPAYPELFCFLDIIEEHLSVTGTRVVARALTRNKRYHDLSQNIARRLVRRKRFYQPKVDAEPEAEIITAIVEYELRINRKKPRWKFSTGGLSQLATDFLLVREYMGMWDSSHLNQMCSLFGEYLMTDEDTQELAAMADENERNEAKHDKVKILLRPLWVFFMALCYALQEEENELSASDAYWLGLIDEVVGRADLQPERLTLEAAPDPSKAQIPLELSAPEESVAGAGSREPE